MIDQFGGAPSVLTDERDHLRTIVETGVMKNRVSFTASAVQLKFNVQRNVQRNEKCHMGPVSTATQCKLAQIGAEQEIGVI